MLLVLNQCVKNTEEEDKQMTDEELEQKLDQISSKFCLVRKLLSDDPLSIEYCFGNRGYCTVYSFDKHRFYNNFYALPSKTAEQLRSLITLYQWKNKLIGSSCDDPYFGSRVPKGYMKVRRFHALLHQIDPHIQITECRGNVMQILYHSEKYTREIYNFKQNLFSFDTWNRNDLTQTQLNRVIRLVCEFRKRSTDYYPACEGKDEDSLAELTDEIERAYKARRGW